MRYKKNYTNNWYFYFMGRTIE